MDLKLTNVVVPAEAGTHVGWIPACAGMTRLSTERSEESCSVWGGSGNKETEREFSLLLKELPSSFKEKGLGVVAPHNHPLALSLVRRGMAP